MPNPIKSTLVQLTLATAVCVGTVTAAVHFSGAYEISFNNSVHERVREQAKKDQPYHEGIVQVSPIENVDCGTTEEDCNWNAYRAASINFIKSDPHLGNYCIKSCKNNGKTEIEEIKKVN